MNKKLGYYKVGDADFESKIQACIYAGHQNKDVNWHFNDEEFSSHNWTVEPYESLDTLYDQRSKELREKYDYIMISYSGGADSHNILASFLRQGLLVDELVINTFEKGWTNFIDFNYENKSSKNYGAEHFLQTIPRLKEIEKISPKTKITICDLTDYLFQSFTKSKNNDWILQKKEGVNPIGVSRYNYLYDTTVRKRFDKNKSIGIILGIEKPKSLIHRNKFYFRFVDRAANQCSIVDHYADYDNTTIEFFYWDISSAKMLIKQAHTIKKWVESNPLYLHLWDSTTTNVSIARVTHERLLRPVIYSTWNQTWFQVDKNTRDAFCEHDSWFVEGAKGCNAWNIWADGVDYIRNELSVFTKVEPFSKEFDGLKTFDKNFYIGDMILSS